MNTAQSYKTSPQKVLIVQVQRQFGHTVTAETTQAFRMTSLMSV